LDNDKYIERRSNGRFRVKITLPDGKRRHVGVYDQLDEARKERDLAMQKCSEMESMLGDIKESNQYGIRGVTASTSFAREDELYERARSVYWDEDSIDSFRNNQTIEIGSNIFCGVFVADLHFGNRGTDTGRIFYEADIISEMKNTGVFTAGDMMDMFIINKLLKLRMNAPMGIEEELILFRRYITKIAPMWLASVDGNHDLWLNVLTGINFLQKDIADVARNILYDPYDCRVTLVVGDNKREFPGRIRHLWRGYSIYNDTHGIERAALFDGDFIWGVGAHTHASGLTRQFNVHGQTGMAALCGSYKRYDEYARQRGFRKPNDSTAVAIIFDAESGDMIGLNNIETAAKLMDKLS